MSVRDVEEPPAPERRSARETKPDREHHDRDHHDHDHDHHTHAHDHPSDARDDGHHGHDRDARAASKLPYVFALTVLFFGIELAAATYAHSNALRADAIHLLADVLAIGIAYAAYRLADRRPSARFTFGLRRIEAVAALINALLVMLGSAEIIHEGVESLRETSEPKTSVMLAVAGAALVVHGLNATLLHRDLHGHGHAHPHPGEGHMSPHVHVAGHASPPRGKLHVHGAWLHVVGDALGALAALVAAAAIRLGAPRAVDPVASFFVAALLVVGALKLVRDATLVLMEAAPSHLPVEEIERVVCAVEGVECVHRLRVWTLGTGYDAIALHVTAKKSGDLTLATSVEKRLKSSFHVDYVCVQVDAPGGHRDETS